MAYSMEGWIESLRPYKMGHTTYLIDSISDRAYGYIWEFGPVTVLNVTGFHGERLRAIKIFEREWTW